MMRIGICDDNAVERGNIKTICEQYLSAKKIEYDFEIFTCGEEVLEYCSNTAKNRIDILFLDIEMKEINGIEVKDRVIRNDAVWRIVFVSSHIEMMRMAFGLKTLGFIYKPVIRRDICKWLDVVYMELMENIFIAVDDDSINVTYVSLEDIEFFKAEGNYTQIYLTPKNGIEGRSVFSSKNLRCWENEMSQYSIIRVHKSYLVNLAHVMSIDKTIIMRDINEKIPLGRVYKDGVVTKYRDFVKNKIRKRM